MNLVLSRKKHRLSVRPDIAEVVFIRRNQVFLPACPVPPLQDTG